jgi:hypothetical protein
LYVAVVGPGADARASDVTAAREVGRRLAEAGAIVLTGGLIALARRTGTPVVVLGGWLVEDRDGAPVDLARAETPGEAVDRVLRSGP